MSSDLWCDTYLSRVSGLSTLMYLGVQGNTFRFCPNGVIINSPSGYHDIYNHKANVRKGKFYEVWTRNAQDTNTLTTVNKSVHAKKRRTLYSVFSDKAVRSAETFVIQHVDRWNELSLDANSEDWSQPRNLALWSDYLLFDILGDLCFGKSFNIKEPQENPLKMIPHAISSYTRFMYPVRPKRPRF